MPNIEPNPEQIEKVLTEFLPRLRPAEHIRPQLDVGGKLTGKTVEIFEIRPQWDKPRNVYRYPLARATWLNAMEMWRVLCPDDDRKWQEYGPKPVVRSIQEFLEEVATDRHGRFFG